MRMVFAGAGAFGIPTLNLLPTLDVDLAAVITWPDRPKGRGRKLFPTPIADAARRLDLPVIKMGPDADMAHVLKALKPDLLLVVDFGMILPESVIRIPPLGAYNLHCSLLPRWRGAAPCAHAVRAGDEITGVTLFQIVRALDAGPVAGQEVVSILPHETAGELEARLSELSVKLMKRLMPRLARGDIDLQSQSSDQVTFAPKLTKRDGLIPWEKSAACVARHVRSMQPWPRAFSFLRIPHKKEAVRINVLDCDVVPQDCPLSGGTPPAGTAPGAVVQVTRNGITVACGCGGTVHLTAVQPAGKRVMTCAEFLRGHAVAAGEVFVGVD